MSEAPRRRLVKNRRVRIVSLIAVFALATSVRVCAQTVDSKSLSQQLSNPISTIWAVQLQKNTYWLSKPERNVVNLQFQPVLPLALTDSWNLITRPVFQVMNSTPYVNRSGNLHRVTSFGDTILATLISASPKVAGPWVLGPGRSFISRPRAFAAVPELVADGTRRRRYYCSVRAYRIASSAETRNGYPRNHSMSISVYRLLGLTRGFLSFFLIFSPTHSISGARHRLTSKSLPLSSISV
jgi:hypothetical protein